MTAATGNPALTQHPLSAAFPAIPDMEIDALAEDIKKHGQRDPGVLFEGMVLDGWHRYLACEKAGVRFSSVAFDGDDPVAFVLGKNLLRRHLNASQRAAAIVAAHGWRPRGGQSAATADCTAKSLAEKAEVSERTIEHAKTAERAGLGDAVREGRVSAARAAEIAKLPPSRREKAIDNPPAAKKPKADGELETLKSKYEDLQERYETLAETARDLQDKLTAFETTEPDEQQKEIQRLQKYIKRLEQEIQRLTVARNDCQNKNNELIRQVKLLQKKTPIGK